MGDRDPFWPGPTAEEYRKLEEVKALAAAYVPREKQEEHDRLRLLRRIGEEPRLLYREALPFHLTASVWISDPRHEQVLLAYHKLYQAWAWLGGHADGDGDLFRVALREAEEESGLTDFRPLSVAPVSLEILPVAPQIRRGKAVSAHEHANFTWLLEAEPSAQLRIREDENSGLRWIERRQIAEVCSAEPEMLPVYAKLERRLEEFSLR